MIYIKNRIITSNESDKEVIISFENANDVFFNILNLRVSGADIEQVIWV